MQPYLEAVQRNRQKETHPVSVTRNHERRSRIMKNRIVSLITLVVATVFLSVGNLHAEVYHWDSFGEGEGTGGSGIWDTTSELWRAGSAGGPLGVYGNLDDDRAVFGGTEGTVTLNSDSVDLNANRITFSTTGYTIAPPAAGTASIVLSGSTPAIDSTVASATISAPISGGSLTKLGTGTLTLAGTNTYSGGTILSAGTLEVSALANLGSSSAAITFANNSIHGPSLMRITGTDLTSLPNPLVLGTTGGNLYGGIAVIEANHTVIASGDITGAGILAKAGPGTLRLTGTNTSTGGIQAGTSGSVGTVEFASAAALGTGPIQGNYISEMTLKNISGASLTLPNNFGSVNNRYRINFTGGDFVLDGAIAGWAPYFRAETGVTVTINSPITTRIDLQNTIGNGHFILNPPDTSTTTISTINMPVGLGVNDALGKGTGATLFYNGTHLFAPNGPVTISTPLQLACYSSDTTTFSGDHDMTFSGALTYFNVNGGPILNVTGTGVTTFSGDFTHTATNHRLRKSGDGVLALTGNNTTGWIMEVTGGVLRAQPGTGLSPNSLLRLNGGVLEANGMFDYTLGSSGGGNVRWNTSGGFATHGGPLTVDINGGGPDSLVWGSTANFVGAGHTLIFGSTTANNVVTFVDNISFGNAARTIRVNDNPNSSADWAELSGTLSSSGTSGGLVKTGDGKLVLSGANTYQGTTTISAGTLVVNNTSGSGTGTGSVTVSAGATLAGTGAIAPTGANGVTVAGTLTPGNSIGTLTFDLGNTTGGLAFADNSSLEFELGPAGSGDLVRILNYTSGDLSFGSNVVIDISGDDLTKDTYYALFEFYEDDGLTLTAHGLETGLSLGLLPDTIRGAMVDFSNPNLIRLYIIPEPTSLVLLGLGALAMLKRRRR